MSALLPFMTVEQPCEQVDVWVREKLTNAGPRIVQTSDLRIARLAHPDCTCPNHVTNKCSCQLVILLVYGKQENPATLVIHGQDGKTSVALATPLEMSSRPSLEASVRHVLLPPAVDASSLVEIR